ncbi:MarR family winged helix-turn-helix transcriptional regulator [Nocardioides marmoraquaticus]
MLDAELTQLDLTMRHLGALGHLARDPGLSISDLARRSGVTAQSMHATVQGLTLRGALETTDVGRGRPARLTITGEGRRVLDAARDAIARVDAALAAELGPHLSQELRSALAVVSPSPSRGG